MTQISSRISPTNHRRRFVKGFEALEMSSTRMRPTTESSLEQLAFQTTSTADTTASPRRTPKLSTTQNIFGHGASPQSARGTTMTLTWREEIQSSCSTLCPSSSKTKTPNKQFWLHLVKQWSITRSPCRYDAYCMTRCSKIYFYYNRGCSYEIFSAITASKSQ